MVRIPAPAKTTFLLFAIATLTGCNQTPATVGTDTYKEQTTTTVSVDRATGAESRNTSTQIITPGDQARVDVNAPGDGTILKVESNGDGDFSAQTEPATTHIRAPLFKMDKNDDSGSVHIRVPFVHIDKEPGGSAHVDIGRHH